MRTCPDCKCCLPDSSFGVRRYRLRSGAVREYPAHRCRPCDAARRRAYCAKHAAKVRALSAESYADGALRERHLLTKYGITSRDYKRMEARQGGLCAVCRRPPTGGRWSRVCRLHVDHSHESGKVRGLLCYRCNMAAGFVRDDPAVAAALTRYLRKFTNAHPPL